MFKASVPRVKTWETGCVMSGGRGGNDRVNVQGEIRQEEKSAIRESEAFPGRTVVAGPGVDSLTLPCLTVSRGNRLVLLHVLL